MSPEEKKKEIDLEDITVTGSASHGFGKEDFAEKSLLDEDDDDELYEEDRERLDEK